MQCSSLCPRQAPYVCSYAFVSVLSRIQRCYCPCIPVTSCDCDAEDPGRMQTLTQICVQTLGLVKQGVSAATNPPVSAGTARQDTAMVCLLTDAVDAWYDKLVARGHKIEQVGRRLLVVNALRG